MLFSGLRKALALKPNYAEAHNQLLDCLFLKDNKTIFFDELDSLINQDKTSAIIGSLTSRSALKYGLEKLFQSIFQGGTTGK